MKLRMKKLLGRSSKDEVQIRKKKKIGARGEGLAATFLQRHGIEILERNYRHGRGEIDIVARDGNILVFVEVKTATTHEFGPPEGWIDSRKQSQLAKIAAAYLQEHRMSNIDCRFDVVTVDATRGQEIRHIRNAFWLET